MATEALVVIDVQQAFEDPSNPPRNNPDCDANIAALIKDFRGRGEAIIVVRHDSVEEGSMLARHQTGNALKPFVEEAERDLFVTKSVNSAFLGEPDLDGWLKEQGIERITVCGIQTNFCCETTARMGGNLGYDVTFAIDATHTFDLVGPDGETFDADTVARMTAANLHEEFATVTTTAAILERALR